MNGHQIDQVRAAYKKRSGEELCLVFLFLRRRIDERVKRRKAREQGKGEELNCD